MFYGVYLLLKHSVFYMDTGRC